MSPDDIPLLFRYSSRGLRSGELREFLRGIARGRNVTCLITDDREMRRLNRQFRGADYATDVLSFPNENGGEIAISLERAKAQAAEHGHSVFDEVRILMLHGVLHLSGMDHENDSGEMARAEVRWRRKLGLPTGLIERARSGRPRVERARA
jgi:probable rRNA maturation factor